MSTFHYSNLRVKFDGEEGSGPGVNRGFFAAVANALKTDEKVRCITFKMVCNKSNYSEESNVLVCDRGRRTLFNLPTDVCSVKVGTVVNIFHFVQG